MERTILPKKNSIRKELEAYVIAWNKILKGAVGEMNNVTLLRNAHPAYRSTYARDLMEAGHLSKFEAGEFIKMVGSQNS